MPGDPSDESKTGDGPRGSRLKLAISLGVDILVIIALVMGGALYWYRAEGLPRVAEAGRQVEQSRVETRAEAAAKREKIQAISARIGRAEARRDSLVEALENARARIPDQVAAIQVAQERNGALSEEFLKLRASLAARQDRLQTLRVDAERVTTSAADLARIRSGVRDSVWAADQRRLDLLRQVEEMAAYRERDPWSVFPLSSSVSAFMELGGDVALLEFSLAKDFYRAGRLDLGVTGVLGFGDEQGTSVKEAGLYGNLELAFRRASLDIGAGYSSVRVATGGDEGDPYLSLTLRYAPYYRERAFLLLGSKYSHEALSYLAGVGLGRR
jgi:hypothetical protein